jgi:hypothetical protein
VTAINARARFDLSPSLRNQRHPNPPLETIRFYILDGRFGRHRINISGKYIPISFSPFFLSIGEKSICSQKERVYTASATANINASMAVSATAWGFEVCGVIA